jgi:hypothetical protein
LIRILIHLTEFSARMGRTLVANEGINRVTRGSYYETTTIGKFSYRELLGGGSVDYSADTVEWNRIRKSIREWANSI